MSITKLEDNVGTGQSLLGSVLHSRVDAQGIVPKTVTRVFIAASLASGSVPSQEICDFHAVFLGETDTDVTGLFLLVQRDSCIHALEASPETITALLRHMLGTPMFSGITIVSAVEDCPSRCFASWSYRSVALPQEPMLGEAATVLAATGVAHAVCRGLTQCGVAMKQVVSESVRVAHRRKKVGFHAIR